MHRSTLLSLLLIAAAAASVVFCHGHSHHDRGHYRHQATTNSRNRNINKPRAIRYFRDNDQPLKIVTIAFRSAQSPSSPSSADVSCLDAEFVRAQLLPPGAASLRSPHNWFELDVSSSKGSNNNSDSLLTPQQLLSRGVASLTTSATIPQESPVYAASFVDPHHGQQRREFVHLFHDPRFEHFHTGHHVIDDPVLKKHLPSANTTSSSRTEHTHIHNRATERFWVPASTTELRFTCTLANNGGLLPAVTKTKTVSLLMSSSLSSSRNAEQQASPSGTQQQPELISIRVVGPPETTISVVFLSGGYLSSQRDMFVKNATDLTNLLIDKTLDPTKLGATTSQAAENLHRTCPFNRYAPFLNFYAVFQPSNEQGASRPLINQVVDNNLKCLHPAEIERAVSCDRDLAFALAQVSPAPLSTQPDRVVIINIVNTFIYGGSASYVPGRMRMASFFNGFYLPNEEDMIRMLSLVDHELGHALGDLMDEYSIGVAENSDREVANCQKQMDGGGPPQGSNIKWSAWIQAKAASGGSAGFITQYGNGIKAEGSGTSASNFGILDTPQAICGWTNYYKPNDHCAMHRLNDYFFCPVCREQATLAMMSGAEMGFALDWPRFPFRDHVLLVYYTSGGGPATTATTTTAAATTTAAPGPPTLLPPVTGGATTPAPPPAATPAPPSNPDGIVIPPSVVNTTSTIVLHLPRVLQSANGFTVTAFDAMDNAPLTVISTTDCPSCIELGPTNFAKYPRNTEVKIKAVIEDSTATFLLSTTRSKKELASQLRQEVFFRIAVVDSHPALFDQAATNLFNFTLAELRRDDRIGYHSTDIVPRYTFCLTSNLTFENRGQQTAAQQNTTFCSFNLSQSTPYEKPSIAQLLVESFETWVPIVAGAIAIFFVGSWIWAASYYTEKSEGRTRAIFETELGGALKTIRFIMQGSAAIALVASVAAVGVAIWLYYNTSVLGKLLVVVGIIIAVFLYLIAFIGYWAVSSRSRKLLIFNGFVLAIPLTLLIWLLVIMNQLAVDLEVSRGWVSDGLSLVGGGNNNNGGGGSTTTMTTTTTPAPPPSLLPTTSTTAGAPTTTASSSGQGTVARSNSAAMNTLADLWVWLVAGYPEWACAVQNLLECSGWYTSCSGNLGSTTTCPTGCDATNEKYFSPCQLLVKNWIVDNFNLANTIVFICTIIVGLGFLLNSINLCLMWRHKKKLEQVQEQRIALVALKLERQRAIQQQQLDLKKLPKRGTPASPDYWNKALFLLRSLDEDDRAKFIREVKRLMIVKGHASLNKKEFADFLQASLGYQPTKKEVDDIFSLGEDVSKQVEAQRRLKEEQQQQHQQQQQQQQAAAAGTTAAATATSPSPKRGTGKASASGEGLLPVREFLFVFGWDPAEFKRVAAPAAPTKGLLARIQSYRRPAAAGGGSNNASPAGSMRRSNSASRRDPLAQSGGLNSSLFGASMMTVDDGRGGGSDDDDEGGGEEMRSRRNTINEAEPEEGEVTTLSEKDIARMRKMMRRKASLNLGGADLLPAPVSGEEAAITTPQVTALAPPAESEQQQEQQGGLLQVPVVETQQQQQQQAASPDAHNPDAADNFVEAMIENQRQQRRHAVAAAPPPPPPPPPKSHTVIDRSVLYALQKGSPVLPLMQQQQFAPPPPPPPQRSFRQQQQQDPPYRQQPQQQQQAQNRYAAPPPPPPPPPIRLPQQQRQQQQQQPPEMAEFGPLTASMSQSMNPLELASGRQSRADSQMSPPGSFRAGQGGLKLQRMGSQLRGGSSSSPRGAQQQQQPPGHYTSFDL